ncbi:MAG: hypothetical protein MRJ92_08175 [Nitrospira sp.]|nr:hypothetical protein [Nitrospira sp.]
MAEQGKGLYDHQYARFRDNQGTHQELHVQHTGLPGVFLPPWSHSWIQ